MKLAGEALKTDLYELTMAAGYFENRMKKQAVFELYCHTLPPNRRFLIACGLAQALEYILNFRFTDEDIRYIRSLPGFKNVSLDFFHFLRRLRFSGNVWALPEGEIFFANEPILQIEAPIIEAQLLETYLLSIINIETVVASKAARVVVTAASDGIRRPVIDFGSRRAQGPEAGVLAARAAYIGGCAGTSNVFAGRKFGIPVYGTMAHAWVQAFDREEEAFKDYTKIFPRNATLLIDTYDVEKAVRRVVKTDVPFQAVRIDSGDLAILSRKVRAILDAHGRRDIKIIASGNLNEYRIQELIRRRAPIDAWGVGTDMVVSRDYPVLDLTYKLVQTQDQDGGISYRIKLSQGKNTVPGRKQVFRRSDQKQMIREDTIALHNEKAPARSRPLLNMVIRQGRVCCQIPTAQMLRARVQRNLKFLSKDFFELDGCSRYPVRHSKKLMALSQFARKENGR